MPTLSAKQPRSPHLGMHSAVSAVHALPVTIGAAIPRNTQHAKPVKGTLALATAHSHRGKPNTAHAQPALAAFGTVLHSSFQPHPLLYGAHLQTLATLLRPAPKLTIRHERLELADGDFLDLGWSGDDHASRPLAVLVHGLAGGFESKYLLGTAKLLVAKHWRVVMLQLRGAGPVPNRLHRCYNQGDTEDLRYFWHLLRQRQPQSFIAAVGWSLGANVTLKALAEEGISAPVNVAAAASVPFCIRPCADRLRRGFSWVYQKRLLDSLKNSLRRKHPQIKLSPLVNLPAALAAQDFIAFDQAYTAPLAGYNDVADYYSEASCGQFLKNIRRRTLIVHALDDPFMTPGIIPNAESISAQVTLEVARHGGHVGFISAGNYGKPYCWLEQRLVDFLHDAFEQHTSAETGAPTDNRWMHN